MGRSLLLQRAGLFDNPGEIPDEGGRGPECVTPGLPSHDCIFTLNLVNKNSNNTCNGPGHGKRSGCGGEGEPSTHCTAKSTLGEGILCTKASGSFSTRGWCICDDMPAMPAREA